VPDGKPVIVIVSCGAVIASDRVTDLLCAGLDESTTLNVKLLELLALGCPEIIPVEAARLSPAGRLPGGRVQV
jgi:hypothetical protein